MCLAIPAKVVEINKGKEGAKAKAKADFGGVSREIGVSLVDAKVGDYVMVHAGFAIVMIDEKGAKKTIELWKEMLENVFNSSESRLRITVWAYLKSPEAEFGRSTEGTKPDTLCYMPCLHWTFLTRFPNNLTYSKKLNPSSCASLAMIFLAM